MYTSYKTFTISCAEGSTGPSVTEGAAATSVISQRDADVKALGLATRLAYEFLVCNLPPDPAVLIYCSAPVSAHADATAGHVPQTFTVNFDACAVYSLVSQAEADAAALLAAQLEANHERDTQQKLIFYNTDQSFTDSCNNALGPDFAPGNISHTVVAGTFTSNTSQSEADFTAFVSAKSIVHSLLSSTCLPLYKSVATSYTATCTGSGMVGSAVTVAYSAGAYISSVSQADANALALAAATAAANSALVCITGFYNTVQSGTASCLAEFGPNWIGSDTHATIPAGAYFDTTLVGANALASAAAVAAAAASLICTWGGGIEP